MTGFLHTINQRNIMLKTLKNTVDSWSKKQLLTFVVLVFIAPLICSNLYVSHRLDSAKESLKAYDTQLTQAHVQLDKMSSSQPRTYLNDPTRVKTTNENTNPQTK